MQGLNAIVTGGAVRIGRAIAVQLAEAGVNVCIHYGHSQSAAEETLNELRTRGVRATSVSANFEQPCLAARHVMDQALQELGAIQILINSAAIFETGTVATTSEDQWDRHFAINLKAPFFLSQAFAAQDGSTGSIVNIIDWRGTQPVPGHLAYTLTKNALVGQTKLLAQELGPRIRVNAVAPGAILPPPGQGPEALTARAACNPLQRVGEPQDVARAVMYLLESPFVTGEIMHVSGGEQLAVGSRYLKD